MAERIPEAASITREQAMDIQAALEEILADWETHRGLREAYKPGGTLVIKGGTASESDPNLHLSLQYRRKRQLGPQALTRPQKQRPQDQLCLYLNGPATGLYLGYESGGRVVLQDRPADLERLARIIPVRFFTRLTAGRFEDIPVDRQEEGYVKEMICGSWQSDTDVVGDDLRALYHSAVNSARFTAETGREIEKRFYRDR